MRGLLGLSPPVEDLGAPVATAAEDKFGSVTWYICSIAWTTTGSLFTAIGKDIVVAGTTAEEASWSSKFDIWLKSLHSA